MNVVRTTTLAIGASLIGSSLFIVLAKPDVLSSIALVMGVVFLLHGTGFLQEYIVEKFLRWYRTKKPVIAIINDLPWSEYGHVWSKMEPREWLLRINNAIRSQFGKAKLSEIRRPWTRWLLDRYSIILNPYGPKYPETDIENLTVMRSILHYVREGGMFVNVADMPFFFPYDKEKEILCCPTRTEAVHFYKKIIHNLQLLTGLKQCESPFPGYDSPFSRQVMVDIVATTLRSLEPREPVSSPMRASLKLKNKDLTLTDVAIHRGIACTNHVESIVEELEWEEGGGIIPLTPFCYIHFGKGKFLISLVWLDQQPEDIREKITNLLCDLVIKEVRRN